MAIKYENTSGPQGKAGEKRAEAARAAGVDEDKKKAEAASEEGEDDKASEKAKKPRAGFKKK